MMNFFASIGLVVVIMTILYWLFPKYFLKVDRFIIDQDLCPFDLHGSQTDLRSVFVDQLFATFDLDLHRIQIGISNFPKMRLFNFKLAFFA